MNKQLSGGCYFYTWENEFVFEDMILATKKLLCDHNGRKTVDDL